VLLRRRSPGVIVAFFVASRTKINVRIQLGPLRSVGRTFAVIACSDTTGAAHTSRVRLRSRCLLDLRSRLSRHMNQEWGEPSRRGHPRRRAQSHSPAPLVVSVSGLGDGTKFGSSGKADITASLRLEAGEIAFARGANIPAVNSLGLEPRASRRNRTMRWRNPIVRISPTISLLAILKNESRWKGTWFWPLVHLKLLSANGHDVLSAVALRPTIGSRLPDCSRPDTCPDFGQPVQSWVSWFSSDHKQVP
jgi:hypothetical protein